jgi:two-component system, OmpR family, sensor histidine kinase KdpD
LPADEEPVPDTPKVSDRQERVLLFVGPEPSSAALIRRGRRVADGLRAECLAVYVGKTAVLGGFAKDERERLERHLNFARALQIETRVLEGRDIARTLLAFARTNGVTQIFVDRNARSAARRWLGPSLVERIVNGARGLQVTVVADRTLRS